ncbi:MAG TPA: tetratricopeptide repeat protein [Longimicrobiales bacterium]|nr:tetratricopeptide repeat protein [Longimicrobiales bacterium]
MIGLGHVLTELRRRKVFRAAVGYSVGALAVVEAADLVLPRLGISDSVVTVILVAALLGFPVAVTLAWLYELTPDGLVRTSASEVGLGSSPYLVSLLAIAIVVGCGALIVRRQLFEPPSPSVAARTGTRSLAVLPFEDMSASRDQAWFGEGVAEEILAALTRVPNLSVVARQSSFALRDAPLADIAGQLGVTHVLSGSVRTEGSRARIRAQLTEVASHAEVWSRDFQPELTSVLDAQEEIARAVVGALEIELGAIQTGSIMSASTHNPMAYEHYLRGLRLWNRRSESDILSSVDHFRQAVEADSGYAAAWAGLAYAHLVLPEYSPTADVQLARDQSARAAERALAIDANQPDALTAMGWGRMIHHYDWSGAEEFIAHALRVDPTNVNALHWQSHVLSWQGRHGEAVRLARRATEIDPLSVVMRQNLAFILMEAGEYEEGLREAERALAREPNFEPSLQFRWSVNTRLGRFDAAAEDLEMWLTGTGRDPVAARALAAAFRTGASGFRDANRPGRLPAELVSRLQPGLEVSGQLYASVGDKATTLGILEQAYRERAGARSLLSIGINPLYDFMRDDPDFLDLLGRVGLASSDAVNR